MHKRGPKIFRATAMRLITKQRMTSRERCARTNRITARPKLTQLTYSSAIRYDDDGSVSPNRGKQYAASQQLLIRIAGMLRITLALRVRVIWQPNEAHQWRAAKDARFETDTQSARPLNAPCWVPNSWKPSLAMPPLLQVTLRYQATVLNKRFNARS